MMFEKLLRMNVLFNLMTYSFRNSTYFLSYRQSSYQYDSDEHILHELDAFTALQQFLHHDNSIELFLFREET
jgi:hypothetical protein